MSHRHWIWNNTLHKRILVIKVVLKAKLLSDYALEHVSSLPTIIETTPIIFGFLISIFIGLFFGHYPAPAASHVAAPKAPKQTIISPMMIDYIQHFDLAILSNLVSTPCKSLAPVTHVYSATGAKRLI